MNKRIRMSWQSFSLVERIRILRFSLPIILIPLVILYQLQVAFRLEESFGHPIHYAAEIAFYSLVGPIVTWLTLVWVEKKLAEKETLERQVWAHTQQLANLTAASSDAILSLDHDGKITSWNKGAERLFEYSEKEILGKHIEEILLGGPFSLPEPQITHDFNTLETRAITRSGQSIHVDLTQSRLEPTNGDMPASLLIMRDVTMRTERAAILEEERGRISRDLHDGVAQTLYFMALKADLAKTQLEKQPHSAVENMGEIGRQARKAIRDVRRVIFGLKPVDWGDDAFFPALKRFVTAFGQEVNLTVSLEVEPELLTFPHRLEPTIFRLVQESLNNIAKHASATEVKITLIQTNQKKALLLKIKDNGVGFKKGTNEKGFGLGQMEKRVLAWHGKFDIESQVGKGTMLKAELPLSIGGNERNGRNPNFVS